MPASLTLKWGNVKGWDDMEEGTPARAALDKYLDKRICSWICIASGFRFQPTKYERDAEGS